MNLVDWSLIGAPLLAGALIISTHVLLGREVLQRGIIFIDLCIAQVAALGVVVAHALHLIEDGHIGQLIAIASALFAAGLLAWTERQWPRLQEAIIGSLYVLSASAALLVLSGDPHGAEQLHQLLAGQILWITLDDLPILTAVMGLVLAMWLGLPQWRPRLFYFVFALAITASVQMVGVFLVFASLILPALAVHGMTSVRGLVMGYAIGIAGYLLGLTLSLGFDLPAGPLVVCCLAGLGLITATGRRLAK